jgi:hypothetical protein
VEKKKQRKRIYLREDGAGYSVLEGFHALVLLHDMRKLVVFDCGLDELPLVVENASEACLEGINCNRDATL